MNSLYFLAAALLWPLPALSAPAENPPAEAGFATVFAEFLPARDALLRNPDADLPAYKDLLTRTAARVVPGALSLEELAQGAFAGLFDLPPSRSVAAERAAALQAVDPPGGARAAAIRLRLLGNQTIDSDPDPDLQGSL